MRNCTVGLTENGTTPDSPLSILLGLHDETMANTLLMGMTAASFLLLLLACGAIVCLLRRNRKDKRDPDSDVIALKRADDEEAGSTSGFETLNLPPSSPSPPPLRSVDSGQQTDRRGSSSGSDGSWSAKQQQQEPRDRETQISVSVVDSNTQTEKQVHLVETWTAEEVREWLMEVSLERYKPLLVRGVTGPGLLQLSHKNELRKLGVDSVDAKRLKEKIGDLKLFNDLIRREEEFRRRKKEWAVNKDKDPEFADLEIIH